MYGSDILHFLSRLSIFIRVQITYWSIDAFPTCPVAVGEIAALTHESWYYTMEV
jgi:hypothetical protein